MSVLRKVWTKVMPFKLRRQLSNIASIEIINSALEEQITDLRTEIDELRADQRRVAQLMDTVEQLVLRTQSDFDELED